MTLPDLEVTVKPDLDGQWVLTNTQKDMPDISIRVHVTSDHEDALMLFAAHAVVQEEYRARAAHANQ